MNRRQGFTLVELLVAATVVAVLVSVLLPVLGASREAGKAVVCRSNLRQVTLANLAYADDNDAHVVRAARDIMTWPGNYERWHGKRDGLFDAFDPSRGDLAAYLGPEGRVKACPSFEAGIDYRDEPPFAFEAGAGGYGYNQQYLGGRYDLHGWGAEAAESTARLDEVARPSETVVFADAAYVQGSGGELIAYSFIEPPFWPGQTVRPNPSIHFRHAGAAHAAWVDGHVDAQTLIISFDYITHSHVTGDAAEGLGIGWFGPDDNAWFDLE